MSNPFIINDEDRELFRQAMSGVTPLAERFRKKSHLTKNPPSSPQYSEQPQIITNQSSDPIVNPPQYQDPPVYGETILNFSRSGVQHRFLQRFKQGQIDIKATIDLHRLTVTQAIIKCQNFFDYCYNQQIRHALLIHGKTSYNNQPPVLKNILNTWLRDQSVILAFHSAKAKDGGTGALYLLLKSK